MLAAECEDNIRDFEGLLNPTYQCIHSYSTGKEDQQYGPEEIHNDSLPLGSPTVSLTKEAWTYTSAGKDGKFPVKGELGMFDGDGFRTELIINSETAYKQIDELIENKWIDRQTRAVFLEFILYNADSNQFSFVTVWVEIPQTGGPIRHTDATIMRIYASGFNGIFQRVMEVLFLALLLANIGISVYQVISVRSFHSCITTPRVILDICIFTLAIVMIIAYALRYHATKNVVRDMHGNVVHFVPFQMAVFYHLLFMYMLSCVTFFACLKLVTLLRLMERIAKLAASLRYSAWDVTNTTVLLTIGVFAFAALGYLAFSTDTEAYRSLGHTFGMLVGLSMGEFKGMEKQITDAKPLLQFYIVAWAFFAQTIVFNMLIAVIIEAHDAFKNKSALEAREHELVEVIMGKMKKSLRKALDRYTQIDGNGY